MCICDLSYIFCIKEVLLSYAMYQIFNLLLISIKVTIKFKTKLTWGIFLYYQKCLGNLKKSCLGS